MRNFRLSKVNKSHPGQSRYVIENEMLAGDLIFSISSYRLASSTHLEHRISFGWINNICSRIQRFGQEAIAQHELARFTDQRQVRCLPILIPDDTGSFSHSINYHLAIMTK